MPGMITHYLCGQLCLDKLSDTSMSSVIQRNRQLYNLGTQGPDFFFYYLPALWRKRIAGVGGRLHNSRVGQYFGCLVDEVLGLKDKKEKEAALAYLAGYLTHYALDTHAHPYVYYMSGFPTKGDKRPKLQYSIAHRSFETNLDTQLLRMVTGDKPSQRRLWQLVKVGKSEAGSSAGVISRCLGIVYGIKTDGREVYSAMRSMARLTRVLQAFGGRRKRILLALEGLTLQRGRATSMIHDQEVHSDYMNMGAKPWFYPWEKTSENISTFMEMFDSAIEDAEKFIRGLDALVSNRATRAEFLSLVGNKSFKSGQDCSKELEFIHHAALS